MHDTWWDCFNRLLELENLRSVALLFDRHGGSADDYGYEEDLLQDRRTRAASLQSLLELAGLSLQELAIRHNQDFPPSPEKPLQSLQTTGELSVRLNEEESLRNQLLGGLKSLRISLVHEQIRGESGTILKVLRPHPIADIYSLFCSSAILVNALPTSRLHGSFQLHNSGTSPYIPICPLGTSPSSSYAAYICHISRLSLSASISSLTIGRSTGFCRTGPRCVNFT
jgi:hypothetical protein